MLSRFIKFYSVVLVVSSTTGGVLAAENSHYELSGADEATVEDQRVEAGNQSETIVVKTNSAGASKQKGRSVKMIVGGQSTDGVAKEVSLPIED